VEAPPLTPDRQFPAKEIVRSPEPTRAATRVLARFSRALLRRSGTRQAMELVATRVGHRRLANSRLGGILIYHVRQGLSDLRDSRVRYARLLGGGSLAVRLDADLWQCIYFRGIWEPETTYFVMRHLRRGDTFLDVGAANGYYSMIGARIVGPLGRVFAFEPNPTAAGFFDASVERLGCAGWVHLERAALSAQAGTVVLYLPTRSVNAGQASTVWGWTESDQQIRVRSLRLDDYVADAGIRAIRLIKIDVEGAEARVLEGAHNVIANLRPDAIICEFANQTDEAQRCATLELLRRNRYVAWRFDQGGALIPHDYSVPSWDGGADAVGNLCFTPSEAPSKA
jgi:FkbM family methyltransferase